MYRLLIVDDEEIIVDGLFELFSYLTYPELDVYKAYSGEEAIDWLNRTRVDIVLTDIRMPEIDGLQLLEMIYNSWPQCKVIFLTGYNEFEYVYKAIQHDNVKYILKTEDPEKVIEVVKQVIEEIEKSVKIEDLVFKAKEQMNVAQDLFQNDYLIHLLRKDPSININKSQFEQLSISLYSDKPIILLIGHVDNIPDSLPYWNKMQYLYSVRAILRKNLKTHIRSVDLIDEDYRLVLFIQPKELFMANHALSDTLSYKKVVSFLKGTLEIIQVTCRESLNASITFALSGEPCNWGDVPEKYLSLNQLLNYRIGNGIEMILIDSEFNNDVFNIGSVPDVSEFHANTDTLETLLRQRKLDTLELYLDSGQSEKFFEYLYELFDPLTSIRSKNSNIALEAYYKVALILLSYINRCNLTEEIAFHIGQYKLMRIDRFESWEEAVEYICELSSVIFKLQNDAQRTRADNVINYIQKFIAEHINEDLSLVKLAEQVSLNPSYLSRLYKQITSMNLSIYIDNVRIEKAKELLQNESVKIYEVAKLVSYDTPASFTRFFRRLTGLSPQEFQETFVKKK